MELSILRFESGPLTLLLQGQSEGNLESRQARHLRLVLLLNFSGEWGWGGESHRVLLDNPWSLATASWAEDPAVLHRQGPAFLRKKSSQSLLPQKQPMAPYFGLTVYIFSRSQK